MIIYKIPKGTPITYYDHNLYLQYGYHTTLGITDMDWYVSEKHIQDDWERPYNLNIYINNSKNNIKDYLFTMAKNLIEEYEQDSF